MTSPWHRWLYASTVTGRSLSETFKSLVYELQAAQFQQMKRSFQILQVFAKAYRIFMEISSDF